MLFLHNNIIFNRCKMDFCGLPADIFHGRKEGLVLSAILTNVYNHYLTTYAPKSTTQFDTHKKSELRSVYNSIVKLNKESPWYLPDNRTETMGYAIGLKENARELRNTIASLGGLEQESLLNKKVAYSDNPDIATASFIGEYREGTLMPTIDIEVKSLASAQKNLGTYLPDEKVGLPADTYSFDVGINGLNYEFQFNINENETNRDVQERLVRLINNAGINLTADLHEAGSVAALRLASNTTGSDFTGGSTFTVSDDRTSKAAGTVEYFGLNYVASEASNAVFLLNGEERNTTSNNFTVGKMYEVQLNGISEDGRSASIGLKTDVESLTENVKNLIGGYNSFLKAMDQYTEKFPGSTKLSGELGNIVSIYKNELDSFGLSLQEDHSIAVDDSLLTQTASEEDVSAMFSTIKDFANSLVRKTAQVSLDPMNYVDKKVVAYKHPGHEFVSPYTPSPYSGMLFNSYC